MLPPDARGDETELRDLLQREAEALLRYLERAAGGLLRYESAEDLAQGLSCELLARPSGFEARDASSDRAWLFTAARAHLVDRRRHWSALKRGSGLLLRGALSGTRAGLDDPDLFAASQTGPSTFAWRREQLVLAAQALSLLLERDRRLVELASEGASNAQIAASFELSTEAAAKAKNRALERLRRAHELVVRARTAQGEAGSSAES